MPDSMCIPISASRFIMMMLLMVLPSSRSAGHDRVVFYIAKNGSDSWSGMRPTPNRGRTDGPFASFERARDAVRQGTAAGLHTAVCIRQGVYRFDRRLELDSADSGTKEHPIIWSALNHENVRCIGGRTIGRFRPVQDPVALKRIRREHRGKIIVADLRAQGVTDFGVLPSRMNLFFRGGRMPVARYSNQGNILADPRIVDPVGGDSRLRDDSPAWRTGFRRIPLETIGLVADEFRTSARD